MDFFDRQHALMYNLDWFFDAPFAVVERILSQCAVNSAPKDHWFERCEHSMNILKNLKESRGNTYFVDICQRKDDIREWWASRNPQAKNEWKPILVLLFHYHVVMHYFHIHYSQLDSTHKYYGYFCKNDLERLNNTETIFLDYITDIEKRVDYKAEIGNSLMWLIDYALEYTRLMSDYQSKTNSGLHGLLSQLHCLE